MSRLWRPLHLEQWSIEILKMLKTQTKSNYCLISWACRGPLLSVSNPTPRSNVRVFLACTRKTGNQPRSQGFSVRTRRDTRKPWSGPVNFAFWLANTILSKNNWTWQLTITIQHLYFYDSCEYEYVLQNNLSK
jgi:hypothetical protein